MKNILGYYLMPHPPLIIPSIGKGDRGKNTKYYKCMRKYR